MFTIGMCKGTIPNLPQSLIKIKIVFDSVILINKTTLILNKIKIYCIKSETDVSLEFFTNR